jgi:hypothetical protein
MSLSQKLWIAEFIFGNNGQLQSLTMHETGQMVVKFFDNGGNFHHIVVGESGKVQTWET